MRAILTRGKERASTWFSLSPQPIKDHQKKKELAQILSDLALAIVFGVLGLPVVLKWCGWFLCYCAFLYIMQSVIYKVSWLPLKTRLTGAILLGLVFVGGFWSTAYAMWRTEKSEIRMGQLRGAGEDFDDGKLRMTPLVQIGDSGTEIFPAPPLQTPFQWFPDAPFTLKFGRKGPLVTTYVRDRFGNLVVSIDENRWTVYPPFCSDKNYTDDAFEALDSSGHVVLQLRLLPNRVQVQGEWWDDQGNGKRLLKNPNGDNGQVIFLGPRNQSEESLIKRLFKYPSAEYWGELNK
ncbi:MAG: hypothetical protein ACLP3K_07315 [Candidatus Acidiferrales bacterium]